ncbi:MAG: MFS transporter, partial [Pirellulaceae bacterium]
MWSLLERDRIVAGDEFNRWMVPAAALCIHLCIGMAYGFSVFWLPMTRLIGIDHSVEAPAEMTLLGKLVTTQYDWDKPSLGWIYTLFFVFLGGSAAWFGRWLEAVGPRAAGFVAACCWSGGLLLAALGVYCHQLWLVWLGAGGIGGIGLGLGYLSPVSTLIKWFPDRRGMAAGLAIMGFGGGAMIGSPLADRLMKLFSSSTSPGVWQTFVVLAGLYLVYMMIGAFAYRIPKEGWRPDGWQCSHPEGDMQSRYVPLDLAWKTPQFVLLWMVLCLNVSAGIGLLGMASPLLQEVFGGRLIGEPLAFEQLDSQQLQQVASIAAGFTGLLSLFNIVGRFFWASLSDYLGRQATFACFFALGCLGYASIPSLGHFGSVTLYVSVFCGILTMYGGGFATIPAYLADQFGTRMVGAIHGRLLTAWSVAGVFGPVRVNLDGQFRCGGSRLYENWITSLLTIDDGYPFEWKKDSNFEVALVDSPEEMEKVLAQKNLEGYKARITAGYCWTWNDPNPDGTLPKDVVIGNWSKPWNVKSDRGIGGYLSGELWAIDPKGFDQIGCVYTVQGFEYDWNGVIIGPDLVWRTDKWVGIP